MAVEHTSTYATSSPRRGPEIASSTHGIPPEISRRDRMGLSELEPEVDFAHIVGDDSHVVDTSYETKSAWLFHMDIVAHAAVHAYRATTPRPVGRHDSLGEKIVRAEYMKKILDGLRKVQRHAQTPLAAVHA